MSAPPTATERQRRAFAIVGEALDVPDAEREAFLREACGPDADLRRAVDALLGFDEQSLSFLDGGLGGVLGPDRDAPEAVGEYRVVGELGRGGMGVVYAAERTDGAFEKTVALKVAQRTASREAAARFDRERRVLARLDHPGIARLLDGGLTPDGRPYFIMERVDGEPITHYADARGLDLRARLALVLDVCDAVAHAHRLLVVHRDLKPGNVFVEEDETGAPRVKLLDFGIAKALDEDDEDALTRTGGALTPAYAAPEQVTGEPVTAATDVYALGVLLYELLVGRRPYSFPSRALAEVARVVREQEPTRPSDAVGEGVSGKGPVAESGPLAPEASGGNAASSADRWAAPPKALRGDLDAIVMTALRKEPERRYATAGELADDLRRYAEGRPVAARGDGLGYRASRFVRRNALGVGAATAVALAVVGGIGAVLWQARETAREAARATATLDYVLGIFESVDPVELEGGELTAEGLLAPGLRQAAALDAQPLVQASLLEGLGRLGVSLALFPTADSVLTRAADLRRRVQGPDHPDVAVPLTWLAQSYTAERRYDEALEAAEEAARLASGGDAHAAAQIALADVLYRLNREGDDARAKALYRAASRQAAAPEAQVNALVGLAILLEEGDSLDAALPVYRRASAVAERAFGPTDPRTADVLYSFAFAAEGLEDADRARDLHERALAVYERAYGRGDYRTAQSLYTLGALLTETDPPEAERYLRAALEAYDRSTLDEDHLWREYARVALGGLLLRTGRPADALPLATEGARAFARDLGPEDPRTLGALEQRGAALAALGRTREGVRVLREVDAVLARTDPDGAFREGVRARLREITGAAP